MNYKGMCEIINASPIKVYLTLAGGGQSFAYHYLKFGGASKTIAGINIPYGQAAFEEFIGQPVTQFVSKDMAVKLALQSFKRARKDVTDINAIGMSVTCSLATENERVGRIHKAHIGLHTYNRTEVISFSLPQGALTREQEETVICDILFTRLLALVEKDSWNRNSVDRFIPYSTFDIEVVTRSQFASEPKGDDLVVIIPGSWNPCHEGHIEMAEIAEEITGVRPQLELTINNADKGIIDYFDVKHRENTIPEGYDFYVTEAKTFLEKAETYAKPGREIIFVVGADTWNRILNPKYAGPTDILAKRFAELGVRFLPFNREGYTLNDDEYMHSLLIFDPRARKYRNPISSTEIRAKQR